jgi:drug/metabolite transporter (DMT)-like permease
VPRPGARSGGSGHAGRLPAGVGAAIAAAALFGASTPFAKRLLGTGSVSTDAAGTAQAVLIAALLYLGSGLGLTLLLGLSSARRHRRWRGGTVHDGEGNYHDSAREAPLTRADVPWLAGAVLFGGIVGPALQMLGLRTIPGSTAALLLNLEGVFTALLAWFLFHENFDRRIATGMAAIVGGGLLLSVGGTGRLALPWGSLAIVGACVCWGLDNNLTQKVSAGDPVQVAAIKGVVAGTVNLCLALSLGAALPSAGILFEAGVIGFLGYGISLVLFVLALRQIGTARTGAYFCLAPFVGAALSLLLLRERLTGRFAAAAALMGFGIWLHLTERHQHRHRHEAITHEHRHVHDEHHQHEHPPGVDPREPHSHVHTHAPLAHTHPHYPDIHHRHRHRGGSRR